MDLLINASFVASFFAGIAALFAPCCITVLLPTYFASVFKQKTAIFLMTFIYFLGLLVVFLPIGFGAGLISQLFSQYHNTIFSIGGIFLIFLGLTLLLGKHFSIPLTLHPKLETFNIASIFILGIFSAAATTCCAPVLAGVLTLSVLPGSSLLGILYTLAYVLGITAPLFIIASFLDKTDFTKKFFAFRKKLNYTLFGQKITLTIANLFSGLMFLSLGIMILYLEKTNQLASHSSYQLAINIYLTKIIKTISNLTNLIPEFVWILLFLSLFLLIMLKSLKQIKNLGGKNEI